VLRASWRCRDGESLALIANLSDSPTAASPASANAQPVWGGGFAGSLAPWAVHWWREAA
jgi:hypothetical protein